MNAKTVRINTILTSVMLFLYTGCGVLNLLLSSLVNKRIFNLPTGIFLCLAVMLPTVVLLICGIKQAKQKQGKADMIFSIATLIVSIVWMIVAVLNWAIALAQNLIIEFYYRLNVAMSLGALLSLLSYVSVAYILFTTVVALYLLAVYGISILRTKQKWLQIKAELHKPAVALLILASNMISVLRLILNRILVNNLDLDAYITYTKIFTYGSFALELLLAIVMCTLVLVLGLIIKKRSVPTQDAQPTPQPATEQPFDLPAGVRAEDL